ncbi:ankyrin repeats (3 copies) domain-containing protein [Pochonia chlamydosporia 170]|uniref:Ankyrin repeats (3 copies) domain-containing protein n=1 Tax=Pochonia chlamydosporia 170 TaxID=1380566 RepID=A0A179F1A6_METCM|nr:ankyrin repeats (3 copies) domain-containing protein [Pochonia chlamydosporia 170]OAQ59221.1 ankyrin repeats (3 copies) domain-containing protein [Pochonia chlamydosporia 170]
MKGEESQEYGVGRFRNAKFEATILHIAAKHGLVDVVEFLLANGANVNAGSSTYCYCNTKWKNVFPFREFYPLHFALVHAESRKPRELYKAAELLIQHGAYLVSAEQMAFNFLYRCGFELLDLADKTRTAAMSTSILLYALSNGSDATRICQDLLTREEIVYSEEYSHEGDTLLHGAMQHGDVNILKHVLDRYRGDYWSKNEAKQTPLHLAASKGHDEAIRLFFDRVPSRKTFPMEPDRTGNCPISYSLSSAMESESRRVDGVNLILDKTKDLTIRQYNDTGDTLLHMAVQTGDADLVSRIMRCLKTNVTGRNARGDMPIHRLAASKFDRKGAAAVIKVLIDAGCPIDSPSSGGTPLAIAIDHQNYSTAMILLEAGSGGLQSLGSQDLNNLFRKVLTDHVTSDELKHSQTLLVSHLIKLGADVEWSSSYKVGKGSITTANGPPLFLSMAAARNEHCTNVLLAAGAKVDIKVTVSQGSAGASTPGSADNAVALIPALLHCHWKRSANTDEKVDSELIRNIELLLEHSVRLDYAVNGVSTFDFACESADKGQSELLKLVLDRCSSKNLPKQVVSEAISKRKGQSSSSGKGSPEEVTLKLLEKFNSLPRRLLRQIEQKSGKTKLK